MSPKIRVEPWDENIPDDYDDVPGFEATQDMFVLPHDRVMEDRATTLPETNEITPGRPVEPDGRVLSGSKEENNLNKNRALWYWIFDLLGWLNAEQFAQPGDGNMDGNDKDTNIYDPNAKLLLMCAGYGGCVFKKVRSHLWNGTWYEEFETFDFDITPEKINGVWTYKGQAYAWETHPHLFATRVNRRTTRLETWLTSTGLNTVTDVPKGDEHWPYIAKNPVVFPRAIVRFFKPCPQEYIVYKNSVIVDGDLVPQSGGILIMCDKYRFYGTNVYMHDSIRNKWYLAHEMLVQAKLGYPGVASRDYRCYAVLPGETEPFMGRLCYPVDECGWQRVGNPILGFAKFLIGYLFKRTPF